MVRIDPRWLGYSDREATVIDRVFWAAGWCFKLFLIYFVLSFVFPSLQPRFPNRRDLLPPPRALHLPGDMQYGDVIEIEGKGKAELIEREEGKTVRVRYIAGKNKGVLDIVHVDQLKPIHSEPRPIP